MHPLDQYPNAVLNRIFYFLLEEAPNNCPAIIDCPNRARRLAFVSRRWRDLFFPCLFHRVSIALWEPFETQALHVHYLGPSAPLKPFKNLVHHVVLVEHAFTPRRSTNTTSQTIEILNTFPCLASVQRDDTNSVPRVFALPASLPTLTAVDIGMVDAYTAQKWLSLPYLNSFAGTLTPGGITAPEVCARVRYIQSQTRLHAESTRSRFGLFVCTHVKSRDACSRRMGGHSLARSSSRASVTLGHRSVCDFACSYSSSAQPHI